MDNTKDANQPEDSTAHNHGRTEHCCCNPQITDGTQSFARVLESGPTTAANASLDQAQSQSILFANMVNQQAQAASIAATTLPQELSQLFDIGDEE